MSEGIIDLTEYKERMIGKYYRHFKGAMYEVTDIVLDCETLEPMVVYKALADKRTAWCRELKDFETILDKNKYPESTQERRFELA